MRQKTHLSKERICVLVNCMHPNQELEGLNVTLDRLTYYRDDENLPKDTPHAFIYHLSVHNRSQKSVTLMARKWVVQETNGNTQVVEGDKIVGKTPTLKPGQTFSYNSYHVVATNAQAQGSFHGVDEGGNSIYVKIPSFDLVIP